MIKQIIQIKASFFRLLNVSNDKRQLTGVH